MKVCTAMTDKIAICKDCASTHLTVLDAEANIHFRGLKALNKPAIFIFSKLVVCLGCGLTQFKLEGQQVELLRENIVSERITL
jgi:hypothetical protein